MHWSRGAELGEGQGYGGHLHSVLLKFPAGAAGWRHKPRPLQESRPFRCRAPIRREPGSPREPIKRGLRRALQSSEPIGGQAERGLPGQVGPAGSRDATCGREGSARPSGDRGTLRDGGAGGEASPRVGPPASVHPRSAAGDARTWPTGAPGPRVGRPGLGASGPESPPHSGAGA